MRRLTDMCDAVDVHGQSDMPGNGVVYAAPHMRRNGDLPGHDVLRRLLIHMRWSVYLRRFDYVYRHQYLSGDGDLYWSGDVYTHQDMRADIHVSG